MSPHPAPSLKEVFQRRMYATVGVVTAVHAVVLVLHLLLTWAAGASPGFTFSWLVWSTFQLSVVASLVGLYAWMATQHHAMLIENPWFSSTVFHFVFGALLALCYQGMFANSVFTFAPRNTEGVVACLNHAAVFLVVSGGISAVALTSRLVLYKTHWFFPYVERLSCTATVIELSKESVGNLIRSLPYYAIMWLVFDFAKMLFNNCAPVDVPFVRFVFLCSATNAIVVGVLKFLDKVQVWSLSLPLEISCSALVEALSRDPAEAEKCPLVRCKLFQEFSVMASPPVCPEFYSISQPGGRPLTWKKVLSVILTTMKKFTESKEKAIVSAVPAAAGKADSLEPRWLAKLRTAMAQISNAGAASAAENCQIVQFAVEGLSRLVEASITDDTYGVVQSDVPSIVQHILKLYQVLERFKGAPSSGIGRLQEQELRSSVRTALHRICSCYDGHILAKDLTPEFRQRVTNYANFLEG